MITELDRMDIHMIILFLLMPVQAMELLKQIVPNQEPKVTVPVVEDSLLEEEEEVPSEVVAEAVVSVKL